MPSSNQVKIISFGKNSTTFAKKDFFGEEQRARTKMKFASPDNLTYLLKILCTFSLGKVLAEYAAVHATEVSGG